MTNFLVHVVQAETFHNKLHSLKTNGTVQNSSKLKSLNPFVDSENILRVGGRLRHSNYSYNKKHQIILPNSHRCTKLLIDHIHRSELHAGTQTTLAKIRNKFWPLSDRIAERHTIRKCVICFKANRVAQQQRIEPARPFVNTGVDYCGPLLIRHGIRKRAAKIKVYIAIFVCMAVKAVHIEVVKGLDSDSFTRALKRFIGRRGMRRGIWSDNGTSFINANKELKKLQHLQDIELKSHKVADFLSSEGIEWYFIPPRAPHFGGIWEAAMKSFKYHFKRFLQYILLLTNFSATSNYSIYHIAYFLFWKTK
ncbi:hypothetical protein Trydic_g4620 [Trypoxylus dichotomus]